MGLNHSGLIPLFIILKKVPLSLLSYVGKTLKIFLSELSQKAESSSGPLPRFHKLLAMPQLSLDLTNTKGKT